MKLHQLITQYVTFRQSMGEDFESSERLLMTFCRRMGAEIDINDLQTEQVEVFLAGTGSLSGYWRRKYNLLRGLYRYAISRDLVADAPLPKTVPRLPQRFLPYLYRRRTAPAFQCCHFLSSLRGSFRSSEPLRLRSRIWKSQRWMRCSLRPIATPLKDAATTRSCSSYITAAPARMRRHN
jgi:hypothetical protein